MISWRSYFTEILTAQKERQYILSTSRIFADTSVKRKNRIDIRKFVLNFLQFLKYAVYVKPKICSKFNYDKN